VVQRACAARVVGLAEEEQRVRGHVECEYAPGLERTPPAAGDITR
jgi:hypothetical protein